MSKRYPMCGDQPAQIDCRDTECKFHEGGSCVNTSPAITLNPNSRFVCWSKQSPEPEQQPPSESEREVIAFKLKSHITTQLGKRGIDAFEDFSEIRNEVLLPIITDFILSREKEKDAEIERLKSQLQDEHRKYTYYRDECERLEEESVDQKANRDFQIKTIVDLKAENERLKGEREEHAIGFAEWLPKLYEQYGPTNQIPMTWVMHGEPLPFEFKKSTPQLYTEYLKSNNR